MLGIELADETARLEIELSKLAASEGSAANDLNGWPTLRFLIVCQFPTP
jgi:hypothetical protein